MLYCIVIGCRSSRIVVMVTVALQLARLTNRAMFMRRDNMDHVLAAVVIKGVPSVMYRRLLYVWTVDARRAGKVLWAGE